MNHEHRHTAGLPEISGERPDHYAVLGIETGATEDEIARAYRDKAKLCHPDPACNDGGDMAAFNAASEARDVLSSPQKRAEYDRSLPQTSTGNPLNPSFAGAMSPGVHVIISGRVMFRRP